MKLQNNRAEKEPLKILVWQTAFLGDLVLTSNLLLNLHKNFPNTEIWLIARPFSLELFSSLEWLKIIPFKKRILENIQLINFLKKLRIPLAISPHRSLRASLSLFLAGIEKRVGFDKAEGSFLYTDVVPHRWGIHEIERNLLLLKAIGGEIYTKKTFLPIDEKILSYVAEKFKIKEPAILIFPSANFKPKIWKASYFAEVIEYLKREGFNIYLCGAPSDIPQAVKVLEYLKHKKEINFLVGKTSIKELVHLIKLSKLVITNDSAPTHIANAVGVPALTIYCATSKYYGFYPLKGIYLEPKNLNCFPCHPAPKKCKRGDFKCTEGVKPKEVIEVIIQLNLK